jgi:hypothetical protein
MPSVTKAEAKTAKKPKQAAAWPTPRTQRPSKKEAMLRAPDVLLMLDVTLALGDTSTLDADHRGVT